MYPRSKEERSTAIHSKLTSKSISDCYSQVQNIGCAYLQFKAPPNNGTAEANNCQCLRLAPISDSSKLTTSGVDDWNVYQVNPYDADFSVKNGINEWRESKSGVMTNRSSIVESFFEASFVKQTTNVTSWGVRRVRLTAVDSSDQITKNSLVGTKVFIGTTLCGTITGTVDETSAIKLKTDPNGVYDVYC